MWLQLVRCGFMIMASNTYDVTEHNLMRTAVKAWCERNQWPDVSVREHEARSGDAGIQEHDLTIVLTPRRLSQARLALLSLRNGERCICYVDGFSRIAARRGMADRIDPRFETSDESVYSDAVLSTELRRTFTTLEAVAIWDAVAAGRVEVDLLSWLGFPVGSSGRVRPAADIELELGGTGAVAAGFDRFVGFLSERIAYEPWPRARP
jgi:hypothetical protein